MIDIKTHARMHSKNDGFLYPPMCTISDSKEFDTLPQKISASESLQEGVEMLLPHKVPGFEMESKKWGRL
jgi:hypothetical protein